MHETSKQIELEKPGCSVLEQIIEKSFLKIIINTFYIKNLYSRCNNIRLWLCAPLFQHSEHIVINTYPQLCRLVWSSQGPGRTRVCSEILQWSLAIHFDSGRLFLSSCVPVAVSAVVAHQELFAPVWNKSCMGMRNGWPCYAFATVAFLDASSHVS